MPLPQKKLIPTILLMLVLAALAAPPLWWSQGNDPVIAPTADENNHGPANIGQAKHMAKSALDALRPILPATAADIEADLVGPGKPIPNWNAPATQEETDKNHAPLLIGQLKAIADPFYRHLHTAAPAWLAAERIANGTNHPGSIFPWTSVPSDDNNKAVANIGQLKTVFSLRFTEDAEVPPDGLPDLWEHAVVTASTVAGGGWLLISQITSENADQAALESGVTSGNDGDGDGIPDNILYSVEFEVREEHRSMRHPIGYQAFVGAVQKTRYQVSTTTEEYTITDSESYTSTSDGLLTTTSSYREIGNSNLAATIQKEGTTLSEWKTLSSKTLGTGERLVSQTTLTTVTPSTTTATETFTTTTYTTSWEVKKHVTGNPNDITVRSGTEIITVINRTKLSEPVTYQDLWTEYLNPEAWSEADGIEPGVYGPRNWLEYTRAVVGDVAAAEFVRNYFLNANFRVSGTFSRPGSSPLDYGTDSRLKSLRWRWVRFNPLTPFGLELAAPPAAYRQRFLFSITQNNFRRDRTGSPPLTTLEEALQKGILEVECLGSAGGGWHDIDPAKFGAYKLEKPTCHETLDFSNWGYSEVLFTLLPVNLISDLNNDGEITAADNQLRDAALASGADGATKDKGTEYLFINDKMSNGVWDADDDGVMSYSYGSGYNTMPKPPATHKDDDDAEPLRVHLGGLKTGAVWFDHPTIDNLEFFKTKECKASDKLNIKSASPFDLSTETLPETIYMRLKEDWAGTDQEGNLRMFIGKDVSEIWGEIQLPLTVVRDFGSAHFFHAARDYILENNSRVCIRDLGYPFGPDPSVIFRLCVMREEATTMVAFDAHASSREGIEESLAAIPGVPRVPAVIINGNQCFWTAGWNELNPVRWHDMNGEIADRCHGRVISGSVTAAISSDNFDTNSTPASGSHLAGPDPLENFPGLDGIVGSADDIMNPDALSAGGKYIGCSSGVWTFAAGRAGGSDALGGLSTNYANSERIDKPHQLVGYAKGMETGKGCIFTATQIKGEGYGTVISGSASISGVPALSPSTDSGAIKLLILDCGAGSLALMHVDPGGTMRGAYMGRKTTFGFPYYVNNYLALDPAPARP